MSLSQAFASLPDPRSRHGLRYDLPFLLTCLVTALLIHINPYYVIFMDGHFYLIGYSQQRLKFLEYRIDRIQSNTLKIQANMIDAQRRSRPVEFSFWIDGQMVEQGLSQRRLSQTPVREESMANHVAGFWYKLLLIDLKSGVVWNISLISCKQCTSKVGRKREGVQQ